MRSLFTAIVAAAATIALGADAFAQSITTSRSVTHSPSIHRGNTGQSAIFRGPQTSRVFSGPVIQVHPNARRGHNNRHQFRHRGNGHGNHFGRRHHAHVHTRACNYTAGHYTTRYEKRWVPARIERQYVPPRYETHYRHDGHSVKRLVANGYYKNVRIDGYYADVPYQTYIPATWSCGYYY